MPLNLRDLGQEYCVWDALLQIALEKQPTSYLEVGTRYGDSLLRVLAGCKEKLTRITIADIWHESYFGANANGTGFERGHKHVERFLTAMGYAPEQVTYLDGDSAVTIPTLDKKAPFDLVLIDGDHNCERSNAADLDLENSWPLVAPGGFLVFDDYNGALEPVYQSFIKSATEVAASYVRQNKKHGIGVAEKESHFGETSKVRNEVLQYFHGNNGIDIGCSRDPLTHYCVAFDKMDYPEVTVRGEADKLPFENETFDWVFSSHCLEDFEDTNAVLTEWLRVLKPGGVIGLYVPNQDLYKGGNDDHKHPGFRVEELTGMLTGLGCEILMTKLDNESTPGCPRYSSLVIARKA